LLLCTSCAILFPSTRTTSAAPLSLHDALPISKGTAIIEKYSGPLDENLVVVESHMGKSHFDSPRAIADQLSKSRPDLKIIWVARSEEHTSELQSRFDLVCRLLLEKKTITSLFT